MLEKFEISGDVSASTLKQGCRGISLFENSACAGYYLSIQHCATKAAVTLVTEGIVVREIREVSMVIEAGCFFGLWKRRSVYNHPLDDLVIVYYTFFGDIGSAATVCFMYIVVTSVASR